jgi:hypothetical protein
MDCTTGNCAFIVTAIVPLAQFARPASSVEPAVDAARIS